MVWFRRRVMKDRLIFLTSKTVIDKGKRNWVSYSWDLARLTMESLKLFPVALLVCGLLNFSNSAPTFGHHLAKKCLYFGFWPGCSFQPPQKPPQPPASPTHPSNPGGGEGKPPTTPDSPLVIDYEYDYDEEIYDDPEEYHKNPNEQNAPRRRKKCLQEDCVKTTTRKPDDFFEKAFARTSKILAAIEKASKETKPKEEILDTKIKESDEQSTPKNLNEEKDEDRIKRLRIEHLKRLGWIDHLLWTISWIMKI